MKVYSVSILTFVLVAALGVVTGGCSEQTPARGEQAGADKTPPGGAAHDDSQRAQSLRRIEVGEHPFAPAMRRAQKTLQRMRKIKDYSAVVSKRERIDGKLLDYETMFVKIRHEPFSVYMKFLGPEKLVTVHGFEIGSESN